VLILIKPYIGLLKAIWWSFKNTWQRILRVIVIQELPKKKTNKHDSGRKI
jgi:hypothetical protein